MRRITIFALVLALLLQGNIYVLGAEEGEIQLPPGIPESIYGREINWDILKSKGLIVYGEPFGDYKQGEYRYLGYDMSGNPYTNMDFPNDADSGRKPYEKNWIKSPWKFPYEKCKISLYNDPYKISYYDKGIEYLQLMADEYNHKQDNAWQGWTGEKLIDYLNIQSPPTDYCPGSAVGWHTTNNGTQVWYQTFQIPALKKITLSNITAGLNATPNPPKVEQGCTADIVVTLDSSTSAAEMNGAPAGITSRRYWASTNPNDLNIDSKGAASADPVYNFTVEDVYPNTTIYCKVRVYSKEMDDAKLTCVAEATTTVNIGTIGIATSGMDPGIHGVIRAEARGWEKFDTVQGIPSGENMYINVFAREYLYDFAPPIENSGTKKYNVTVSKTYILKWEEDHGHYETTYEWVTDPETGEQKKVKTGRRWVSNWVKKSDTVVVSKTYTVERPYSYWTINRLEVYGIDRVEIENDTLPLGYATLIPNQYTPPDVNVWHSDSESEHIIEPAYSNVDLGIKTIDGGRSGKPSVPDPDWTSTAESAVGKIKVRNDRLIFNGTTVMDDAVYEEDTPDPGVIPESNEIGQNVLYKDGLTIDPTMKNGTYNSKGSIYYTQVATVNPVNLFEIQYSIDINDVTVHTPVVCYPGVWNEVSCNQEINPDTSRATLILGRTSKIRVPTVGQHRNILGYGQKDYKKYIKEKQVRFPFDVYIDTERIEETKYLPANQWYSIPVDKEIVDFYLPTWVSEGNYEIEFREIAINAEGGDLAKTQTNANKDLDNYVAQKSVKVRVIGRLYGFKITDINDYPTWENVFRIREGSAKHSGICYYVGTKDENGVARGNPSQLTLPILNGSHKYISNIGAVKTGYRFKFELYTIGNYYGDKDCINIIPRFYYVGKNGGARREVDLWYNERFNGTENYFVKIGSERDKQNTKYIRLADPYRNVPDSEIETTGSLLGIDQSTFRTQNAKLGWLYNIVLSKPLRTFVGSTAGVPGGKEEAAQKSVQKWYGEYYIPNTVFVTEKGYDVTAEARARNGLTGKEEFWLKGGYIIVNFDIQTVKNGDFANPVLSYWNAPECNMWYKEGFNYNKTDNTNVSFPLQDGDVIFYYTDKRASDDYNTGGTH